MYVEGFLVPVTSGARDDYIAFARKAAAIFREHGAIRVVETWADDVAFGEVTSFPRAVKFEAGETAVLGWIEFPDKATRDECMKKTMADPRMESDMSRMPVDGKRMIFGGFEAIVDE